MPNWNKVVVSGSNASLNSLTVSNGITGSLLGTASYATQALSASYATNALSASFAQTASYATQKNGVNGVNGVNEDIDFKNIDIESINPYEVLNVSKKFTWNELKESYRKLAMNTHPDKQGGNKDLFNIITHCFKKLAEELKQREEDKGHIDLKKQSSDYFHNFKKMTNDTMPHPSEVMAKEAMTPDKFNKNFEKCKLYDEEIEFGYGSKMEESTKVREDINIEKLIKKDKIDNESFNALFDKSVPTNKTLIKYREPEPLILAKTLQFTELGGKRPDDYSSSPEKNNANTLAYTDYMKAHEGTRLVDPRLMKNVKEKNAVHSNR